MENKHPRVWPYTGKLAIFTTFYESRGYAPYIKSLVMTVGVLDKLGVRWDYWQRAGDFHVERAINDTLTKFINQDECTDLLMIDADTEWEPEGVVRLLMHPEGIVGGTYRMKHKWHDYVGSINRDPETGIPKGKILADGTSLISASRLAAGFIRFKKEPLIQFHEHYKDARCTEPEGEMTTFYERIKYDGIMHSQDMAFSRRCIEMGIDLWLDPHVKINHYGLTKYEGDYHQFLLDKKTIADAADSIKMVEQMAEELKLSRSAA